jgi:hypothetical protein
LIKLDITLYDRIKDKYETKEGLLLSIIALIIISAGLNKLINPIPKEYNNVTINLIILTGISLLTLLIWLFKTNRLIIKKSNKITAGLVLIIDSDVIDFDVNKQTILKIVRKVVHHINNSKTYKNVDIKILPANLLLSDNEAEKFYDNYNFMYDIIIRMFIDAGQYDSIEKIIIEKFSLTFKHTRTKKGKRIFFNSVDILNDMTIQFASRDWEYLLTNSGRDKKKYFENILPMFLYVFGYYAIYVDRFEDALEIMTPIYNSKNIVVPITKKGANQIKLKLKLFNIAEGRLATILIDLFFSTAIKKYENHDVEKAMFYFNKLELILKSHPKKFDQYINMARYSFELGSLENAIKYNELAKKIKPYSTDVILNSGFFSIINNDKKEFYKNYWGLYKKKSEIRINWVDVLDFQLKQRDNYSDKNQYFKFSISFIEFIFLDAINIDDFKEVVESFKKDDDFNFLYDLGIKILKIKNKEIESSVNKQISKRKKKKLKRRRR